MSKVLFVNHSIDLISGAEESLISNILCLPNEFDPYIITPEGPVADYFSRNTKATIITLPLKPVNKYSGPNILKNRKRVRQAIEVVNPAIVHANTTKARLITPRKACKKLIWQVRDMQKLPFSVKRRLHTGSDKIAIISRAVATYYDFQYDDKIFYLPPAVTFQSYKKNHITLDEKKVIGFIAQYVPWKRHDIFINTISALPKEYRAIMVGAKTKREQSYYNKIMDTAKINGRIEVIPFTEDIVNDIYDKISCLIVCSENEPFGRVIAESFLQKIPVIAYKSGGVDELIKDRETGVLLDDNNPELFANAVCEITEKKLLRKEIVDNAFSFAENNFTLKKQRERLTQLYK